MVSFLAAVPFGIAIGTGIVAFAYMIGSLLQSESLKTWGKLEFGELILSAVLVLLIAEALSTTGQIGITKALTGVSPSPGQPLESMVSQQMYTYMEQPLERLDEAITISSMRLSRIVSYNYNYQLPIPWVSPTGSSSPGAGAGALQMAIMTGFDSTAMNLMLVHAIKIVYIFLLYAIGTLFLPLGIILRFISPLRKMGSLLLGIGIAVYLVFPVSAYWSTSLLAPAVCKPGTGYPPLTACDSSYDPNLLVADPPPVPTSSFVCSPVMSGVYNAGEQIPPLVIAAVACLPTLITGTYPACVGKPGQSSPPIDGFGVAGILSYIQWGAQYGFPLAASSSLKSAGDNLSPEFISTGVYQPMIGYILPLAVLRNLAILFMALMQLAVTIIMARELASVLGAEGQFYGLTKLV